MYRDFQDRPPRRVMVNPPTADNFLSFRLIDPIYKTRRFTRLYKVFYCVPILFILMDSTDTIRPVESSR